MATIRKQDIINELSLHELFVDQPKVKVKQFVEDFFQNIIDNVTEGNEVAVAGFGKFYKYERTADGKGTGAYTPKFKPAKAFKDSVSEA